MKIHGKFSYGKYKGLTVLEVYRGTLNINPSLIKDYAECVLNGDMRLRYENYFEDKTFGLVDEFEVTEYEIKALTFYEEGVEAV